MDLELTILLNVYNGEEDLEELQLNANLGINSNISDDELIETKVKLWCNIDRIEYITEALDPKNVGSTIKDKCLVKLFDVEEEYLVAMQGDKLADKIKRLRNKRLLTPDQ